MPRNTKRMGGHARIGTVGARHVVCTVCPFWSMAKDCDRPCPRCGGPIMQGNRRDAELALARRAKTVGIVGEPDAARDAETDVLLRAAREDAQR